MSQEDFDEKIKEMLSGSVALIHTEELKDVVKEKELIILDTRTPEEYKVSHIEGAEFIDYDDFTGQEVEHLDKNKPVVVYCSVGYRSEKIGEKLQEMGFKQVYNLYGGIFDWKNKGNQVVNDTGVTDSVHTYNFVWSTFLEKGIKVY